MLLIQDITFRHLDVMKEEQSFGQQMGRTGKCQYSLYKVLCNSLCGCHDS